MAIIDFREIPPANTGDGDQDTFELFARDFLKDVLGFKILSQPNRGADGGKDILAEEIQNGALSESRIKWLISCKHFAHSGKSVSEKDEYSIVDRIKQHSAQGFIGFYSTIASSGLGGRLDSLRKDYPIYVFDGKEIENRLLSFRDTILFERYFPTSFAEWKKKDKTPTLLLSEYQPLPCIVCGKDLLAKDADGLIIFAQDFDAREIHDVVPVCRGRCDRAYEAYLRSKNLSSGWESISDFILPTIYLKKQMALINNLFYHKSPEIFTEHSIEAYKSILIALSQLVLRDRTEKEWERILDLNSIPEWM